MAAVYGESSTEFQRMHKRLRHRLRGEDQGVEKVIRSLRHRATKHPKGKVLRTELAYFRRNRHTMRYASIAAEGLPIGSGVVEAACKTLASIRMKRSGMRWRNSGGQAVLTIRGLQQSGDFDLAWRLLHQDGVGTARAQQESPPEDGLRLLGQVAV